MGRNRSQPPRLAAFALVAKRIVPLQAAPSVALWHVIRKMLHPKTQFSERKRIALLVFPPVRELDIVGPLDAFSTANRLSGQRPLYEVTVIRTGSEHEIIGMSGLSLLCNQDYRSFRGEIDTLLVPGGIGSEEGDPTEDALKWLRKAAAKSRRVGSICTGVFLLARAGLLDGRRVTTHWAFAGELETRFPKVRVDRTPIWIQDGNIYTSAGVTSGIDLSLALIEEDHGSSLALEVARNLVVFLRRPGTQAQFSVSLGSQTGEKNALHELIVWIAEHLDKDLSVPVLASRTAMSPRNFHRVFTSTVGKSPARFVEELRVEAARRQIERTAKSLEEIAVHCGLGSADAMRRSFLRLLDSTPSEYRSRFRSSGI
jgi:transcriptional regulator GlxA family with amidase domain